MNTIRKWLLVSKSHGEVEIIKRDINIHIPINRMLDQVGFYAMDSIKVNGVTYLYVYDECERYTKKSKLLITRIGYTGSGEGLVHMKDDDLYHVQEIINQLMIHREAFIN